MSVGKPGTELMPNLNTAEHSIQYIVKLRDENAVYHTSIRVMLIEHNIAALSQDSEKAFLMTKWFMEFNE